MGNPLSNTTSTTSTPLTAGSLASVPYGPGMLDKSLEKQNHEMVALGIPVVQRDMNAFCKDWQKSFDGAKKG
ncbi:hypothetical protein NW766_008720 [Fusarium irregulare]|uniref:Uncharacterized protein n=1 Tax=Fusarium irregulare TaxID=2494466 RepID=A0A9W8U8H0_9HYPO|nr:hypothetical protein NW766_008720 [Fusarium irregulare]